MSNDVELEMHVDDEMVASVSGPRDEAMTEMRRYWAHYGCDGKCTVYEVTRTKINIEDVLGLTAQETCECAPGDAFECPRRPAGCGCTCNCHEQETRPAHTGAHDCACAECVEDDVRCTCKDFPGADEFCTAHKFQPCGAPLDADGVDKCERQKGHTGVCGLDPV